MIHIVQGVSGDTAGARRGSGSTPFGAMGHEARGQSTEESGLHLLVTGSHQFGVKKQRCDTVGFPFLKEESMSLEDELELGENSRRLLSPNKNSGRPKLSNFNNDSDSMEFYKYKLFI